MDEGGKLGKEVLEAVKETQQANRFILKRLNQLLQEPNNHCTCSRLHEQSQEVIKELQSKIDKLEKELAEKDESYRQISITFENFKDKIDSLETSLMALQTDDSKLRSASLPRENASELEDKCTGDQERNNEQLTISNAEGRIDLDQTRPTSNETQVQSVEHSIPLVSRNDTGKSDVLSSGKKEASSNIQEGAVGGVSLQADTLRTVNESSSTSTDKSSNQNTTVPISQSECITEEMNNRKKSRKMPVEVVRSSEKKSYGGEQYWRYLARKEIESAHKTLKDLEGVHTVICLDISESMAEGTAWLEATTFLEDYLKGLSDISDTYGISNEYVALVTFGHVSQVQMRLTNKYNDMRELIGKQKLGGPSPLYAGLAFGIAAAGSSRHIFHRVGVVHMFKKVIIVTDGHVTEVGQYAGPDTPENNLDETRAKILQCMEECKESHLDTFCVPVGDADTQFLQLMTAMVDGRIISYTSGKRMARRQYVATKMLVPLGPFSGGKAVIDGDIAELSEDKETLDELMSDACKHLLTGLGRTAPENYRELPDKNLPPIGSRVRRGPDWKWNTQDSFGPGTVIGHEDDEVWVEWDANGHVNVYRYSVEGYDVLIVEEPRKLNPGQKIAVGCVVKLTKGHQGQKGVVIKLDESKERATVRWNDGKRGEYSYGEKGNWEIEICTGFAPFTSQSYVLGSGESKVPAKKTKKKNKNIN